MMKRILIIEDNLQILEDVQEILSSNGFHVITARNGVLGVQLAKEEYPDLILCDVIMPEMDGFSVLRILRCSSLTATIPVIFLTSKASRDDVREGMELGAEDYLTKPFTASELMKTISTRIAKQETIKKESAAKLDNLRLNITRFFPHELLTPLHGILGMSELLLHHYESMTDDEVLDSIRDVYDSGQRLHRLARNFILFSELAAIAASSQPWKDDPEHTDVKNIIALAACAHAEKVSRAQDLELDLDEAIVKIPSKYLSKVVEEVVDNACKFSKLGTPVRLSSKVDQQFFYLYVVDQGRGMTARQIANIGAYMQFERNQYEQQGNGLGLIISKKIVELYGGEFSVESVIANQTTVCIKLSIYSNPK